MYGTIIQDAYRKDEAKDIVDALDDLCNPNDSYGWSSAGIYGFWNYYTKELLYIGLATDLTERFKQHNGIKSTNIKGCKYKELSDYFNSYDKIGFTIFVQSPLNVPVIRKNIYDWHKLDPQRYTVKDFTNEEVKKDLRILEGILIEAYRKHTGVLPPWNNVSGSIEGQMRATRDIYNVLRIFSSQEPSPLLSRYTIRELSANPTFERYENFLHVVRQFMLNTGVPFEEALQIAKKWDEVNTYEDMINDGYFEKALIL